MDSRPPFTGWVLAGAAGLMDGSKVWPGGQPGARWVGVGEWEGGRGMWEGVERVGAEGGVAR